MPKCTVAKSATPEYKAWRNMHYRCEREACALYPRYGGRGIKVDPRWASFPAFLADVGPRPLGFSLERNDVNGNYTPANVRWASRVEQARNTRRTRYHTHGGVTLSVAAWADRLGENYKTVQMRLQRGRPITKDLTA